MTEIFKDVLNYEGLYQVSNLGRIKSLGNDKNKKEKILKNHKDKYGYEYTIFSSKGKPKRFLVHRLVGQNFIYNLNNFPCINHKDGKKSNNKVNNLEWCTQKENVNHAYRKKLIIKKLQKKDILNIRYLYKNKQYTKEKLSKMFNVCQRQIYRVIKKECWKYI